MGDVYIAPKTNRINPNVVAAGGSLVQGDSAPHGDAPGERKRINPNFVVQAPGSASIADKAVSADELHALAVKAAERGDQERSLGLLQTEKAMRSGDAASDLRKRTVHRMAQQTVGFFKRRNLQGIDAATPKSEGAELRKSLLSPVEAKRKAVIMSLFKAAAKEQDFEKKRRFEKQARELDKLDLSGPEKLGDWMKQNGYAA